MKWFKHYSNAQNSQRIQLLKDELGFEGIGRYWTLLEMLYDEFDGNNYTVRINKRKLHDALAYRSYRRLQADCNAFARALQASCKLVENGLVFEFEAPILLELLGRDFRMARRIRASGPPKNKEERIKNNKVSKDTLKKSEKSKKLSTSSSANAAQSKIAKTENKSVSTHMVYGKYIDLWRQRYGNGFARKPADGAILKRLIKENGSDAILHLLKAYFNMPDSWAVKKAHDLFTFEKMLSEVARFANTGKVFTKYEYQESDEKVHYRQKRKDENLKMMEQLRAEGIFEPTVIKGGTN